MKTLRYFRAFLLACIVLFTAAASARADLFVTLYDVFDSNQRVFGTVNPLTGQFTQISNPSVFFSSLTAGPGGQLYGSALDSNFYSITSSGTISQVGTAGAAAGLRGLAYNGTDYRGVQLNGSAVNLNSYTNAFGPGAFLGQMAPTFGATTGGSLCYGPMGNLYFSFNPTQGNPPPAFLYQVNPATGALTQIGSGLGANPLVLAFDGITLYGFSAGSDRSFYTINTTTGVATLAGTITGAPSNNYAINVAAFAIPEPGILALLCLGGVGLIAARRRFRK